jgi:hypothetical protein
MPAIEYMPVTVEALQSLQGEFEKLHKTHPDFHLYFVYSADHDSFSSLDADFVMGMAGERERVESWGWYGPTHYFVENPPPENGKESQCIDRLVGQLDDILRIFPPDLGDDVPLWFYGFGQGWSELAPVAALLGIRHPETLVKTLTRKFSALPAVRRWAHEEPRCMLLRDGEPFENIPYAGDAKYRLDSMIAHPVTVTTLYSVFDALAKMAQATRVQHEKPATQAYKAASLVGLPIIALKWDNINAEQFERLIFNLLSDAPGYSDVQLLTQTNAPDGGRDISATRTVEDALNATRTLRVIVQCKHWSKSIDLDEASKLANQMDLQEHPKVDELVIATTGRFTTDAVRWIEKHNHDRKTPLIIMWPDSHLEKLLVTRSHLVAEFHLKNQENVPASEKGRKPIVR